MTDRLLVIGSSGLPPASLDLMGATGRHAASAGLQQPLCAHS